MTWTSADRLFRILLCITVLIVTGVRAETFEEGRAAYLEGDYPTAYEILRPLAESGNAEAQKMMGIMYDYGQGVDSDPEQAFRWYLRSAEQGDPAVQYQVGAKYFKGDGIEQNYAEAARWWKLAADKGQAEAQFNLGLMYFRGLDIEQDDVKAADLFIRAAKQDHGHAQYSLGVMYAYGRGIEKDYSEARKWFTRAAEKGIPQAQYNLGIFYENGYGIDADPLLAQQWYQRAAAQGLSEAKSRLDVLNAENREFPDDPAAGVPAQTRRVPGELSGYQISEISPFRIQREDWVLRQSGNNYTIQIASVTSEQELLRFLDTHGLEENTAYIQVVIDGVTRFNAFHGVYTSYADAQQAIASLPREIRSADPWVRNFAILQKMIN